MTWRTHAMIASATVLQGCAAIAYRGPFVVPIDSQPRGAVVMQDGYNLGATPCRVVLNQRRPIVTLMLDGYANLEVDVGRPSNAAAIVTGCLLVTPLIELPLDAAADASHRLETRPILVTMSKENRPRWTRESASQ